MVKKTDIELLNFVLFLSLEFPQSALSFNPCKMISSNQHPLFFLQRGQKRTIESVSEKNIITQFFYNWSKVSSTNGNLKRSSIFRSVSIVLIYHLLSDDVSLFFPQSDFTQQNQSNCVAVFCECK